tara:strand:- start:367 stop:642 length:276 start_codon:yes stop_codon:yes gene_type:complete
MSDEEKDTEQNDLSAAEEKKNQLVTFVANNLLNNVTLSQVVNIVQRVSMEDANKIVTEATPERLTEIEEAYAKAVSEAQAEAESAEDVNTE